MNKIDLFKNLSRPSMAWYVLFFTSLITLLSGFKIISLDKAFIDLWTAIAVGIPVAWIAGRTYEKSKSKDEENV